jgi:ferredoxin
MVLDRGLAERISVSDALKRVGDAEDAGLVHMTRNNVKKDMFICNCCSCCCTGFYFLQQLDYPDSIAPSRFQVNLDTDACNGCGICVDRCQFHAIEVEDVASIQAEKCYGCGNCVITCPEEALTLTECRPKEHIRVT